MIENICRGKRVDNNEWIGGYYVYDNTESTHRIVTSIDYSTGTFLNTQAPRVIDSTVGRYTGLKDKKEKRVFEGDICRISMPFDEECEELYQIKWDDGNYEFEVDNGKESIGLGYVNLVEVVGNIHDNPELLNIK